MQEKTSHAKETDITSVLVISFVVLVAVLIAKVAGDFSAQKTSSSTRASAPRSNTASLQGGQNNPLNDTAGSTPVPTPLTEPWFDTNISTDKFTKLSTGEQSDCEDPNYALDRTSYGDVSWSVKLYCRAKNDIVNFFAWDIEKPSSNPGLIKNMTIKNSDTYCVRQSGNQNAICFAESTNARSTDRYELPSEYKKYKNKEKKYVECPVLRKATKYVGMPKTADFYAVFPGFCYTK